MFSLKGIDRGTTLATGLTLIFVFGFAFTVFLSAEQAVAGHTGATATIFSDNSTSRATNSEYNPGATYNFGVNITNLTAGPSVINHTATRFQLGRPDGTSTNLSTVSTPAITNTTTGIFNISFSQVQLGPAGTYNITWYAKTTSDTQGDGVGYNKTTIVTYVVAKNTTDNVKLLLNGTAANLTIPSGGAVNITATVNNTEGTIKIFNGTSVLQSAADDNITNITTWTGSAGASYNITAVYDATQNYTAANSSSFYIVIEGTGPVLLLYNKTNGFGFPQNASFYKSGDSFTLNVSVDDTQMPAGGFNVTVNLGTTFAANISNSTPVASGILWANGTFSIPSGLTDGNHSLNVSTYDATGNRGSNTTWAVQIDNTDPTVDVSVSDDSIIEREAVTISCTVTDGGSGIDTQTLTVEKPDGSTLSKVCGDTLQDADTEDTGTYDITLTATDKVSHSKTDTASFDVSSSGGGGGGGGGGGAVVVKQENTLSVITPGVASIAKFTNKELGIREIEITVDNRATNVKITVTKLAGQPASITQEIEGQVYKYVDIKTSNLDAENIDSAKVRFAVPKSWLEDNGVAKRDMRLYRYTTVWDELTTRIDGEDSDELFYESDTPGFSTFAMGSVEEPITPEQPPAEEEVTAPPVEREEVVQEVTPPERPQPVSGMLVVLALLLILVGGALYWKREAIFGASHSKMRSGPKRV